MRRPTLTPEPNQPHSVPRHAERVPRAATVALALVIVACSDDKSSTDVPVITTSTPSTSVPPPAPSGTPGSPEQGPMQGAAPPPNTTAPAPNPNTNPATSGAGAAPPSSDDAVSSGGAAGEPPTLSAGGNPVAADDGNPASGGTASGGAGGATEGSTETAGMGGMASSDSAGGAAAGTAGDDGDAGDPALDGDCNSATGTILEVAADGSADFDTVQAAVDRASGSEPTIIRIGPGSYYEKLDVQTPNVTLCGQTGQEASTILTYDDNAGDVGTSGSYSVRIGSDDVSVENLTLENSTGSGVQAVALLAQGDRVQFRNCRFIGYQDTVYAHSGSQYFRDCYIQGSVDFIFGGATAVFEQCTIYNIEGGTAVTAPSTDPNVAFGIVFLGGELTAHDRVGNGSVALGRNWRPNGATAYIRTELGDHVSAVGWVPMGDNTLDTARFSEYQTTGPGANPGARAGQASQLSDGEAAQYTVHNIFGTWTPSFSESP